MKDQIVSFKTAKLAKEKGFNWKCKWLYYIDGDDYEGCYYEGDGTGRFKNDFEDDSSGLFSIVNLFSCTAPTQTSLQRWLREIHKILVCVIPVGNSNDWMYYSIIEDEKIIEVTDNTVTYEDALEKGLQKALFSI
jgi:hypothetical protein